MPDRPLLQEFRALYAELRDEMRRRWQRRVPLGDLVTDRWEIARDYGFGEGTSCYDNVLILGDVKVGAHCWIGPNVILDGSGGLTIGDHCAISAGVQIYTHDTVARYTSMGEAPIEYAPVTIGSGVFVGPQSVIAKGVTIGDRAIVGTLSFVNKDVPAGAKAFGTPVRASDSG